MGKGKKTSIIIVNYNSRPYLEICLQSLLANTLSPYEILIIDNHSKDDSALFLEKIEDPRIRVYINNSNVGYSKACNQGLVEATGDYFVTMNPDVVVPEGWLTRLLYHLEVNPRTLIVGPKSLGFGGSRWTGPLSFSSRLPAADRKFARLYHRMSEPAKFLSGCLLLFDRRLLRCVGFFDENLILGGDNFDLSLRVRRAGYELRIAKDLLIRHVIHGSFRNSDPQENERLATASWKYFYRKWERELKEYGWKRLFEDEFPVFPGEETFRVLPVFPGGVKR